MVSCVEFFSEAQQDKDITEFWVTLGSVFPTEEMEGYVFKSQH